MSRRAADISRDHFTAASISTMRVSGRTIDAIVPRARAVVVTSRNTLTAPARIGVRSELRVRNASSHLQEVFLAPVQRKVTTAQLNAFLAKPSFERLYHVVSDVPDFLAVLSPSARATSSHHSSAGRYLFLTLTVTSSSTIPHLGAGQVRLVTVG